MFLRKINSYLQSWSDSGFRGGGRICGDGEAEIERGLNGLNGFDGTLITMINMI